VRFGLVLLLVTFSFEASLHSVHHLADDDAEASCDFASASSHAPAITPDAIATFACLERAPRALELEPPAPASRPVVTPSERAPPPAPVA